jgi:hypothetical protein
MACRDVGIAFAILQLVLEWFDSDVMSGGVYPRRRADGINPAARPDFDKARTPHSDP